jgi:hypothetical protein
MQAGSYIAMSKIAVKDYVDKFDAAGEKLREHQPGLNRGVVFGVLDACLENLREKNRVAAGFFLALCARLDHSDLSFSLSSRQVSESLALVRSSSGDEDFLGEIIQDLAMLSLIQEEKKDHGYSIRPLVYEWVKQLSGATE